MARRKRWERVADPARVVDQIGIGRFNDVCKNGNQHHEDEHDRADRSDAMAAKAAPNVVLALREDFFFGRVLCRHGHCRCHYEYFTRGSSHAYVTSASKLKKTTRNDAIIR